MQIFNDTFIATTIEACETLCKEKEQFFKPDLIEKLGLDPKSQETSLLISFMFSSGVLKNFRLVKGKNGGIKPIIDESKIKKEIKTDRKCGNCSENGHNARTCTKEKIKIVDGPAEKLDSENNNAEWLVQNENSLANVSEG